MSKLVVLSFGNGDCVAGVQSVTLQIWQNGNIFLTKSVGSLPPAPEISQLYTNWQSSYRRQMELNFRREESNNPKMGSKSRLEPKSGVTNYSKLDIDDAGEDLKARMNEWLKSPSFTRTRDRLLMTVMPDEEIRFIVETDNSQLRLLPWHLWEFFDYHPNAEVALSPLEFDRPFRHTVIPRTECRILAILGDSTGIDIESDREELKKLPIQTVFLAEKSRAEVNQAFWERQGWDILFFAGHSVTEASGKKGEIFINRTESLSISKFKKSLKNVIGKGLKLAIFNSCDGLGIASELASLNIPNIIVMREPVPDLVAQAFLKYFLEAFSHPKPLYLAVREAREKLEGLEYDSPCASWLPVIFQNPTEEPVSWQELSGIKSECSQVVQPSLAIVVCPYCKYENPANIIFCEQCGSQLK
jgi:hypothetical protein